MAATLAAYLAFGDEEAAPQIAFAAYDREQARVCFSAARHMIEANPELFAKTTIYSSRLEIVLPENPVKAGCGRSPASRHSRWA